MIGVKLVEIMEREGLVIKKGDRDNIIKEIDDAINQETFHFIIRDGKTIGWVVTSEDFKDGKRHIYISHALIYREFRNKSNLLYLRRYLRHICGEVYKFYWHSNKRDSYTFKT